MYVRAGNKRKRSYIKQYVSVQNQVPQTKLFSEIQKVLENPKHKICIAMEIINISLSLILIYHYIYFTYDQLHWHTRAWESCNVTIHLYFLMEFLLRVYVAKDRFAYLQSYDSLVEMISTCVFLIIRFVRGDPLNEDYKSNYMILANLVSLVRIHRLHKLHQYIEGDIIKQLYEICASVIMLVLVASGATEYIVKTQSSEEDAEQQNLQFLYYVYFVMTTISTEGYENKFSQPIHRIMIIVLITYAVFFVPSKSSQLVSLLSSKSYYARQVYKSVESIPFVVITGTICPVTAEDFFNELFHQDHGKQQRHAVVLVPHSPDAQIQSLLANSNIIYIEGDPLNESDLRRCQVELAKAVIILTDKQAQDPHKEDAKTILQAMFIKKYLKQYGQSRVRFIMQLLRSQGKMHYSLSQTKRDLMDQVVCIEELQMNLLAKSCLCPGLISMISNLIMSSNEQSRSFDQKWLQDYNNGIQYEIYKVQMGQQYQGMHYNQIVLEIYVNYGAILFAIEVCIKDQRKIFLNPQDMVIPEKQNCKVIAYIVTSDKKIADLISNIENNLFHLDTEAQHSRGNRPGTLKARQFSGQNFLPGKLNSEQEELRGQGVMEDIPNIEDQETDNNDNGDANERGNSPGKAAGRKKSVPPESQSRLLNANALENGSPSHANLMSLNNNKAESMKNVMQLEWSKIGEICYITKEKVNLKDVTFKTLEKNILATDHIVVSGMMPNLINFIMPLRLKTLAKYPTIVFLYEQVPNDKQWNQIAFFPEIYYVQGSALDERDLVRTNIQHAKQIVILSPSISELGPLDKLDPQKDGKAAAAKDAASANTELTKDEVNLLDARTIFKYKLIQHLNPSIQIFCQLVNQENFAFLIGNDAVDYARFKKYSYVHTSLFASGSIYISTIMDSLCCQAYYNSAIIKVLNLLLIGNFYSPITEISSSIYNQKKNNKQLDYFKFYNLDTVRSSLLFQMNVPDEFAGKKFGKLFGYLIKRRQIIALGIYRSSTDKGNKLPYIWTNPSCEETVGAEDLIIILAAEDPGPDSKFWGGPLEDRSKLQLNTQITKKKKPDNLSQGLNEKEGDLLLHYEDIDKDNQRQRQNQKEQDMLQEKIGEIVEKISRLKEDTKLLNGQLQNREETLLNQMRLLFSEELLLIYKKKMAFNAQNKYCESGHQSLQSDNQASDE